MEGQSEEFISRQQKIAAAKEAFQGNQPSTLSYGNSYGREMERMDIKEPQEELQKRHTFRLLRMMAAGMLFFLLVIAFSNGFSYHGFNQEYVQEILNDETTWNRLQCKVQELYHLMEDKWKDTGEN